MYTLLQSAENKAKKKYRAKNTKFIYNTYIISYYIQHDMISDPTPCNRIKTGEVRESPSDTR